MTDTVEEKDAIQEEAGVETPGPIFTRDIPGLAEYAKLFTTEGTEDTEKDKTLPLMNADGTDQRRELSRIHGKPGQVDADDRGLGRDDLERMVMKPILTRDLELLGESHAKMG